MKSFFEALFSYIKRHSSIILAFVLSVAVFSTVFYLYSLPVEAVVYASLVCLVFLLLIFVFRFSAFYKRHCFLRDAQKNISDLMFDMPKPISIIEADYQQIISELDKSRNKIISEKDRSLSDMIDYYTLWAHQIKTPIAAARLVLQSEPSAKTAELSEQLFAIERYVDMVLGYLRSESISSDLLIKTYSIDNIIKAAVKKYSMTFIRKKIVLEYSETGVIVLTDEKWLTFVLEQLISNALKYTPEGGKIVIYYDGVRLCICDTGIGIRKEDLPRLGERGFTGFNGRENKKSTGIGLYLCRKILKKLSHSMEIQSDLGKGTQVYINLSKM